MLFRAVSASDTRSSQLIVDAVLSRIETEKAAESLRKDTFLEENLPIVTFGVVSILGSKLISLSSLSSGEDKATASEDIYRDRRSRDTL